MEISEKVENSDNKHLNLNNTYNNGDSINNFNCNNKEHSQNPNIKLFNYQNQVCANCSILLPVTYPSTLINEDHLVQPHKNEEPVVVENHCIFEIEISLDNDLLTSPNVTSANTNAKSKSVQRIQVQEILSSIYSLNFLHLLSSSQTEKANSLDNVNDPRRVNDVYSESNSAAAVNQNMCICSGCAQVLINLYKYYTEFNQLRTFDSILSKKIHRLDQILENPNLYQIQRPIIKSPAQSQSHQSQCESDSLGGSVVKCEVLAEEGTDPIIFDDDDPFGSVQTDFDENESDLWGNRQDQEDVEPFQPDAETDADKTSLGTIIAHKNSSAIMSAESRGPWVRLSRLRNVKAGSPVRVSKLHRNANSKDRSNVIDEEKRRKIRKSNNNQEDEDYLDLDLVTSGPSDDDNPNDSDFFIENDMITEKRKTKFPLRSNRESKLNDTIKNRIDATNLKNLSNQDNSNSGQAADQSRFESIYTSSSDASDSEPELLVNKQVNTKKSKAKPKSTTKPRSKPKTATNTKSKTKSKVKTKKEGQDSKPKSKPKAGSGSGSASDDATANNTNTEENVDAAKYKASKLKSYRRRKARAPNPCWHCPLDFPTQEECFAHTKATHFSPGDFFCSKCSKLCPNKKSYAQHLTICEKLCPGQKLAPHLCPHCGKSFPLKCDLDMHALIHNEEDSFPCSGPGCTFKTKSQLLLNLHFNRMHVEKPKFKIGEDGQLNLLEPIIHKCDHCEATFKNDHSRRIHMHNLHDPEGYRKYREYSVAVLARQKVERRLKMKDKSFVCPDCNIDFFSYLRLIGHRKTMHNEATEFVCDQCGKDFLREKSLKYHMKFSHTDIRPFICEHCGKAFKTSHNLKDHVNHTHNEEGRQKYNDLMRRKNQRRKIVAEALAKKTATATTTTFRPDGGSVFSKMRKVKNSTSLDLNPSDLECPSDASSSLVYPIPGPSGVIQRLVNSWVPHS